MQSLPENTDADATVNDYLDRVCAPLAEHVPYPGRMEMRCEMLAHLEASISARKELGAAHDAAVQSALEQFGEPADIGRRLLCASATPRGAQRLSRTVTCWLSMFSGVAVGMVAPIPLYIIYNISGNADHSEFWIGGCLGASLGFVCWRGRKGPASGLLGGAATGLGVVVALLTLNLSMNPNYIDLILSDWRSILAGALQFAAAGAIAGGTIGALCRLWRRLERSPRPWVPA